MARVPAALDGAADGGARRPARQRRWAPYSPSRDARLRPRTGDRGHAAITDEGDGGDDRASRRFREGRARRRPGPRSACCGTRAERARARVRLRAAAGAVGSQLAERTRPSYRPLLAAAAFSTTVLGVA